MHRGQRLRMKSLLSALFLSQRMLYITYSSLSLIWRETEVFCRVRPICSAMPMKRCPKIETWIGSTVVVSSFLRCSHPTSTLHISRDTIDDDRARSHDMTAKHCGCIAWVEKDSLCLVEDDGGSHYCAA